MSTVAKGDTVLTRLGYGTIQAVHPDSVEAMFHSTEKKPRRREVELAECFLVKPCAVLRVIYLTCGNWTNVRFLDPNGTGIEFLPSGPSNETRFLLLLNKGEYFQEHELRPTPATRFLHLSSWVDRWGQVMDEVEFKPDKVFTLDKWIKHLKQTFSKTEQGICYHALLDSQTSHVLWHAFRCETGWVNGPSFAAPSTPK